MSRTYTRIVADARHSDCCLLAYDEIEAPEYASWSMGYIGQQVLSESILEKYISSAPFNPFELTSKQAPQLMRDLMSTADQLDAECEVLHFREA